MPEVVPCVIAPRRGQTEPPTEITDDLRVVAVRIFSPERWGVSYVDCRFAVPDTWDADEVDAYLADTFTWLGLYTIPDQTRYEWDSGTMPGWDAEDIPFDGYEWKELMTQ